MQRYYLERNGKYLSNMFEEVLDDRFQATSPDPARAYYYTDAFLAWDMSLKLAARVVVQHNQEVIQIGV